MPLWEDLLWRVWEDKSLIVTFWQHASPCCDPNETITSWYHPGAFAPETADPHASPPYKEKSNSQQFALAHQYQTAKQCSSEELITISHIRKELVGFLL